MFKYDLYRCNLPSKLSVYSVFGIPLTVSPSGLAMDVDRQYSLVKALDGNQDKPKQFFLSSGANGSALEHSVPEQLWSTPDNPAYGISAVKALKIANDQGIPIYTINQSNIDTILPQLQIDTDAKTDIRNAVNAGKEVTVSKTNITYNGWTGCGYIIIDPDTGEGAYMISGRMSGSETKVDKEYWSVMNTFFSLLDLKNSILAQVVKSAAFERVLKGLGLLWTLIEFIIDANKTLETASEDSIKRWASFFVVLSTTLIAAIGTTLPLGIAGGPIFTIIVYNITTTSIVFILNMIEELAIEAIKQAFFKHAQYRYARLDWGGVVE